MSYSGNAIRLHDLEKTTVVSEEYIMQIYAYIVFGLLCS